MNSGSLDRFRVVLVEPVGAGNVGSVARAMRNFGFGSLTLLRPVCDVMGDEARKMALGGLDLIRDAQYPRDLSEALGSYTVTAAFTRRQGRGRRTTENLREFAERMAKLGSEQQVALVFGREDRGLTTDETNLCQHLVMIPSNPDYGSLNLAQSVVVTLYELTQSLVEQPLLKVHKLASHREVRGMYNDLHDVLQRSGFLAHGNPERTMTAIARMIGRSEPSSREVKIVRGALRDLRWYVRKVAAGEKPPLDSEEED
ncbi:MAG: TrmJ/YjtD family RNA methyltransferase [Candidatus Alcyoniella australis]|nr:TrmJ/YjtD family RNA methyltransferase [Candidatus Alcyoniella australis]